ncbi:hypothetical protein HanIR_Chr12g0569671 [Helianthus annuus]|nr:hypothetical protein HanIR_Chr12g0569671 [Helianthus annuus]
MGSYRFSSEKVMKISTHSCRFITFFNIPMCLFLTVVTFRIPSSSFFFNGQRILQMGYWRNSPHQDTLAF